MKMAKDSLKELTFIFFFLLDKIKYSISNLPSTSFIRNLDFIGNLNDFLTIKQLPNNEVLIGYLI